MAVQNKGGVRENIYQMYACFHFSQNGYFYFKIYINITACGLISIPEINYITDLLLELTLKSVLA